MMTTEQLNKYMSDKGLSNESDEQKVNVPESKETVNVADAKTDEPKEEKQSESEPKETKTENAEPAKEVEEVKKEEDKPKQDIVPQKKQYTQQEKIDYAFQKEKAKQKKLQERIKELEAQLKNKETVAKEDPAYIDKMVDIKFKEFQKQQLEDEYKRTEAEQFDKINEQRIKNCFPDEKEEAIYRSMVRSQGSSFLKELDEYDPEQAVLSYLDDCEIAPLMTRILMTDTGYKNEILSKRSPYAKYRAMEKLEEKIQYAIGVLDEKKKAATQETPKAEPKNAIPIVGSVTKSEDNPSKKVVKNWNEELAALNKSKHR